MGAKFLNSGSGGGISVTAGSGTANRVTKFTSATAIENTNIIATGTLVHLPTGLLTLGAGSAPDVAVSRQSAGNINIAAGAVGTTNLLQLGSSGLLFGLGRQVAWASSSDPTSAVDVSLTHAADALTMTGGNLQVPGLGVGVAGVANKVMMPSGGIIDFAAADVTLTHSANTLTLAGGNLAIGANYISVEASGVNTPHIVTPGATTSGFSFSGSGLPGIAVGGTAVLYYPDATTAEMVSTVKMQWSAGALGAGVDTTISRNAAGVVQVGTTAANALGLLQAAGLGVGVTPVANKLMMPSGGIIDFNAANVTLTHSAGLLAVGGGRIRATGTATVAAFEIWDATYQYTGYGISPVFNGAAVGILYSGTPYHAFNYLSHTLAVGVNVQWSDAANFSAGSGTTDTTISRNAAGAVQFGSGATNNTRGVILAGAFRGRAFGTLATTASANTKVTNATEKSTVALAYTKIKEIALNEHLSGFRVSFELKTAGGGATATARVYKNGSAVGTEQTDVTGGYVAKTEDFTSYVAGDLIQIYAKTSDAAQAAYVQNLLLQYDIALDTSTALSATSQDP